MRSAAAGGPDARDEEAAGPRPVCARAGVGPPHAARGRGERQLVVPISVVTVSLQSGGVGGLAASGTQPLRSTSPWLAWLHS